MKVTKTKKAIPDMAEILGTPGEIKQAWLLYRGSDANGFPLYALGTELVRVVPREKQRPFNWCLTDNGYRGDEGCDAYTEAVYYSEKEALKEVIKDCENRIKDLFENKEERLRRLDAFQASRFNGELVADILERKNPEDVEICLLLANAHTKISLDIEWHKNALQIVGNRMQQFQQDLKQLTKQENGNKQ
jgi:HSP20 family molecular chaperone IbpA